MQPHVIFKLNKSLDKKMAFAFLNVKAGGIDFSNGIIRIHSELKSIKKKKKTDQKKIIDQYFDSFYKKHSDYLKKRTEKFQAEWNKTEKRYFRKVGRIFKNHPFPKGKYIGYLSIIDCNPRFLKDKTFQVFYSHPEGVISITAHELLHFIFYDYCFKKYPEIFKKLDPDRGTFWDLAEIFNLIILSQAEFKKIHRQKSVACYPAYKKYIPKLKRLWFSKKDIDEWLPVAFDKLKYEL